MVYFDTSFIAPLLLQEATSERVERFFVRMEPGHAAVSQWTLTEFSSILARQVRMSGLSADMAGEIEDEFQRLVAKSFVVINVETEDFKLARRFVRTYESGVRAGDALHLAIAANRNADAIYSLDKQLVSAAKKFGLPASHGIRLT